VDQKLRNPCKKEDKWNSCRQNHAQVTHKKELLQEVRADEGPLLQEADVDWDL
jgi:hypothetical protein